jgi:hypothetical protein
MAIVRQSSCAQFLKLTPNHLKRGASRQKKSAAGGLPALPQWQPDKPEVCHNKEAMEALILGDTRRSVLARIGVMKALNRHHVRVFNSDRKEHHWGKRKQARDR